MQGHDRGAAATLALELLSQYSSSSPAHDVTSQLNQLSLKVSFPLFCTSDLVVFVRHPQCSFVLQLNSDLRARICQDGVASSEHSYKAIHPMLSTCPRLMQSFNTLYLIFLVFYYLHYKLLPISNVDIGLTVP